MANTPFYVPRLLKEGAWLDLRARHKGGYQMYGDRALSAIRRTPAHHSVTNPTGNAYKDVDTIASIHINGNGWAGIGYHFIVTSEVVNGFAKVAYVGDIGTIRANTPNTKGAEGLPARTGNTYMLAACIIGMNHLTKPTLAQLRSMKLLMTELIWHERSRMPNIPQNWGAMQPHYVYDWTQCNGITSIRNDIINVAIPAETASKPAPAPTITYRAITKRTVELVRDAKLWNFNFTKWADAKAVGSYKKGHRVEVVAIAKNAVGAEYYMTEYSYNGGKIRATNGFNLVDTETVVNPAPEIPKPDPIVLPPTEVPEVRSLGAPETVYIDIDTKVVDIVTGKVTRSYTASEIETDNTFVATHSVRYKNREYYMTSWAYQQFEKGLNPTGVDKETVEHEITLPPVLVEEPIETLPPEPQPDSQKDYDQLIKDLEGRVSILEKLMQSIISFFNNLGKG